MLQIRDALRSDDYVEYIARKVFGLVRPGEALVIVDAPPPPLDEQADAGMSWGSRCSAASAARERQHIPWSAA